MAKKEAREKGMTQAAPWKGIAGTGFFVLSVLSFFAGLTLRGVLRGGFQQNIHQFSRCALSGSWSLLIGQ